MNAMYEDKWLLHYPHALREQIVLDRIKDPMVSRRSKPYVPEHFPLMIKIEYGDLWEGTSAFLKKQRHLHMRSSKLRQWAIQNILNDLGI